MAVASYLEGVLNLVERKERIKKVIAKILKTGVAFDAIAFRGMSGALVAPEVATELGKEIIMVRKADKSHSGHKVEMIDETSRSYIIVDDLIDSGATMNGIRRKLPGRKCVGIFLYTNEFRGQAMEYASKQEIPVYFCLDK